MTAPPEFSIRYDWIAASVPPPYHYEYRIDAGADGGRISFVPDYSMHDPPTWEVSFKVDLHKWLWLYEELVRARCFRPRWSAPRRRRIGGETHLLQISLPGKVFQIPSELTDRDALALQPVFSAVQALVPQAIWDELIARQGAYRQE
jgi:hypothetical protein